MSVYVDSQSFVEVNVQDSQLENGKPIFAVIDCAVLSDGAHTLNKLLPSDEIDVKSLPAKSVILFAIIVERLCRLGAYTASRLLHNFSESVFSAVAFGIYAYLID